jgi:uncharacterized protein DUF4148
MRATAREPIEHFHEPPRDSRASRPALKFTHTVTDGTHLNKRGLAMKRLNQALIVASFVVLPLVSHVADSAPLTRAQVRADLISAEQNGTYPPSKVHYPDPARDPAVVYVANKAAQKIAQAAARNTEANAANNAAEATSYGNSTSGSSAFGSHPDNGTLAQPQVKNLYRGH